MKTECHSNDCLVHIYLFFISAVVLPIALKSCCVCVCVCVCVCARARYALDLTSRSVCVCVHVLSLQAHCQVHVCACVRMYCVFALIRARVQSHAGAGRWLFPLLRLMLYACVSAFVCVLWYVHACWGLSVHGYVCESLSVSVCKHCIWAA